MAHQAGAYHSDLLSTWNCFTQELYHRLELFPAWVILAIFLTDHACVRHFLTMSIVTCLFILLLLFFYDKGNAILIELRLISARTIQLLNINSKASVLEYRRSQQSKSSRQQIYYVTQSICQ